MVPNKYLSFSVIAIAGQIGSGKSTLARELCRRFRADLVSFGDFVRAEAANRNLPADRTTLQHLGASLISELGYQEFVNRVLRAQLLHDNQLAIIDGVRHVEIWQAIYSLVPKSILIYLDIPQKTRLERIQERDDFDARTILRAMSHAMEKNIPKLRAFADVILKESSLEIMISQIEAELPSNIC